MINSTRRLPWIIFLAGFVAGAIFWSFFASRMSYAFPSRISVEVDNNMEQLAHYREYHHDEADSNLKPMEVEANHHGHHTGEDVLAKQMAQKVRVYAMILTMPDSKETKAVHVKATWAKRFNGYVFISSENDTSLPSIKAIDRESRDMLWTKTRFAIIHAYSNLLNSFDFFMKSDDDTYVIVENLRLLLAERDPEVPIIMGRRFKTFVKQGYLSGGAGYVLSRAAIRLIAEGMLQNTEGCQPGGGAEDVNLGKCAEAVGVVLADSLDEHGKECFHPFPPISMIDNSTASIGWFKEYNHHSIVSGINCCSDHSVSFHYIRPNEMYALEFLLYHLYPYGIMRNMSQFKKLQNVTV